MNGQQALTASQADLDEPNRKCRKGALGAVDAQRRHPDFGEEVQMGLVKARPAHSPDKAGEVAHVDRIRTEEAGEAHAVALRHANVIGRAVLRQLDLRINGRMPDSGQPLRQQRWKEGKLGRRGAAHPQPQTKIRNLLLHCPNLVRKRCPLEEKVDNVAAAE